MDTQSCSSLPWFPSHLVACEQVRKIKRRACEYDYVEVMACPGGCLNGGGQFAATPGKSSTQLLDRLDTIYHDPEVACLASRLRALS